MEKTTTPQRVHPITILYSLRRFVVLLVVPVVRGLISALRGGFASWLRGAWMDLLLLLLVLGISVIDWLFYTYSYNEDGIVLQRGWFYSRITDLSWRQVSSITAIHKYILRPVGAVYLRTDSLGGNSKTADLVFYITEEDAHVMLASYYERLGLERVQAEYRPPFRSLVQMAVLSTNSFAGAAYLAAFISQSGKIIGRRFQDTLIHTFEEVARKLAFQIPPAAAAIAYVFLLAWLIGFVLMLLRYRNFCVYRTDSTLRICGGLFTRREYTIRSEKISYLDIRQNLATYLFRYYSLYISVAGNTKEKNDLNRVIPLEKQIPFKNWSNRLFPGLRDSSLTVRPKLVGITKYIRTPLIILGSIGLTMLITIYYSPSWKTFTLFVGIMALIPCTFYLIIGILDFMTTGIGYREGIFTIKYSKGFTLHTIVVPEEKIVDILITQSIWQLRSGRCDVRLYTQSEGREIHRCKNLEMHQVVEFLSSTRPISEPLATAEE